MAGVTGPGRAYAGYYQVYAYFAYRCRSPYAPRL